MAGNGALCKRADRSHSPGSGIEGKRLPRGAGVMVRSDSDPPICIFVSNNHLIRHRGVIA